MNQEQSREYHRKWRADHREVLRSKSREYERLDRKRPSDYKRTYTQEQMEAKAAYMKAYNIAHREERIARSKLQWQDLKNKPHITRAARLKHRYGLTTEQYEAILQSQEGKCALCEVGKPIDIDHNHSTGRVRGILCRSCNVGLGQLGDSINGLKKAIAYLERTGG